MQPHAYLRLTRPDQVAECWEGVPDDLYRALWRVAAHLKPYNGETPPEPDVNSVASVWRHLTKDEKARLNALASQEEARTREAMARYALRFQEDEEDWT